MTEFPGPTHLLGQPVPEFTTVDLAGGEVAFAEHPRLLLSFFNPYYPPCWTVLPALAEVSQEVAVAILVMVIKEAGVAGEHRARLAVLSRGGRPIGAGLVVGGVRRIYSLQGGG